MTQFLSEEWLAELATVSAGLPEQSGVDGTVRFVVTSTPLGRVEFRIAVADGGVSDVLPGKPGDSDATVTWKYPEAVAWIRGELDPDVAFMTGQCKVEGDYEAYVYGLRPLFAGDSWASSLAGLVAETRFE
ncbi:MAG: SCP2 sterol-binding domain-containing protein [Acidimicrobiia bacterium]|nr:SCP2 sterol-binding domain-containing protein [Actinomycetota bacterium]MBL6925164.1 SCP2 sterol-binding domain-containing protein [Acidimicrobiia bacterium]MBL6927232.1 SCP2 sterol-binding domain-containing protein [Acidimicrobiia bacterium]